MSTWSNGSKKFPSTSCLLGMRKSNEHCSKVVSGCWLPSTSCLLGIWKSNEHCSKVVSGVGCHLRHVFSGYENQMNIAWKWSQVVGKVYEKNSNYGHTHVHDNIALGSTSSRHKKLLYTISWTRTLPNCTIAALVNKMCTIRVCHGK